MSALFNQRKNRLLLLAGTSLGGCRRYDYLAIFDTVPTFFKAIIAIETLIALVVIRNLRAGLLGHNNRRRRGRLSRGRRRRGRGGGRGSEQRTSREKEHGKNRRGLHVGCKLTEEAPLAIDFLQGDTSVYGSS